MQQLQTTRPKNRARLLTALLALASGCSGAAGYRAEASPDDPQQSVSTSSLRIALDNIYRDFIKQRQSQGFPKPSNSLTEIVETFVPRGTRIGVARATLVAAGFAVNGPRKITNSSPEVIVAAIDPYKTSLFGFAGKTSIIVIIYPSDLTNEATVSRLEAVIQESYL